MALNTQHFQDGINKIGSNLNLNKRNKSKDIIEQSKKQLLDLFLDDNAGLTSHEEVNKAFDHVKSLLQSKIQETEEHNDEKQKTEYKQLLLSNAWSKNHYSEQYLENNTSTSERIHQLKELYIKIKSLSITTSSKITNKPTKENAYKVGDPVQYQGEDYIIKEITTAEDGRIVYHLEDKSGNPLLEGQIRKFIGHDEITIESQDSVGEDYKKLQSEGSITKKDKNGVLFVISKKGEKYFAGPVDGSTQAGEISPELIKEQFGIDLDAPISNTKDIQELQKTITNLQAEVEKQKEINKLKDQVNLGNEEDKTRIKELEAKQAKMQKQLADMQKLLESKNIPSERKAIFEQLDQWKKLRLLDHNGTPFDVYKEGDKYFAVDQSGQVGEQPRSEITKDDIIKLFVSKIITSDDKENKEGTDTTKKKLTLDDTINNTKNDLFGALSIDAHLMDKDNLILEAERNRLRDVSERKYMDANRFQKAGMFAVDRMLQNKRLKKSMKNHRNNNAFIENNPLQNRIEGMIGTYNKQEQMGIDGNKINRRDLGTDNDINDIAHDYLIGIINESEAINRFNTTFANKPHLSMGNMTGTDLMPKLKDSTFRENYKISQSLLPYLKNSSLSDTNVAQIQKQYQTFTTVSGQTVVSKIPDAIILRKKFEELKVNYFDGIVSGVSATTQKIQIKLRGLDKSPDTEELEGSRYDKLEKTGRERVAKAFHRGSLGGLAAKTGLGVGLGMIGVPALGVVAGVTGLGMILQWAKTRRDAIKEIAKTHEDAINMGMSELENRITELENEITHASKLQSAMAFMGRGSLHRARKQKRIIESLNTLRNNTNETILSVDTIIQRLQAVSSLGISNVNVSGHSTIQAIADTFARIDAGHQHQTQFISTTKIDGSAYGREETAAKRNQMMNELQQACIRAGLIAEPVDTARRETLRNQIRNTPEYQSRAQILSNDYLQVEEDIKTNKKKIAVNAAGNYFKNAALATAVTAGAAAIIGKINGTSEVIEEAEKITNSKSSFAEHSLGGHDPLTITNSGDTGSLANGSTVADLKIDVAVDAAAARTGSFSNYLDEASNISTKIASMGLDPTTTKSLQDALNPTTLQELMKEGAKHTIDEGNQKLLTMRWTEAVEHMANYLHTNGLDHVKINNVSYDNLISAMEIQTTGTGTIGAGHRGFTILADAILENGAVTKTSWTMPDRWWAGIALPFFNTYAKPGEKTDYASTPTEKKTNPDNKSGKTTGGSDKPRWMWNKDDGKTTPEIIKTEKEQIKERVSNLSSQIITANKGPIQTDTITTTPFYIGEERWQDLINAISSQQGNFKSIIYVNGPKDKFSEQEYHNKIAELQLYAAKDPRIIIVGNLYDIRPDIGTVRADMIDAVDQAIDHTTVHNPKIIGLDADTYKLQEGYIADMSNTLDDPNTHWVSGKLRWYDGQQAQGDEYSFILERMFIAGIQKEKGNETYLSGGSYGLKLSEYKKIGGFHRDLSNGDGGEDSLLGKNFNKAGLIGKPFSKKIYVDPRRGQDAVNQGKHFSAQWQKNFQPIGLFTKEQASDAYKYLTNVSGKLLKGEVITQDEQKVFEESINNLPLYTVNDSSPNNLSSSSMGTFIKRWNSATNSQYKMTTFINPVNNKTNIKLISKEEFDKLNTTIEEEQKQLNLAA